MGKTLDAPAKTRSTVRFSSDLEHLSSACSQRTDTEHTRDTHVASAANWHGVNAAGKTSFQSHSIELAQLIDQTADERRHENLQSTSKFHEDSNTYPGATIDETTRYKESGVGFLGSPVLEWLSLPSLALEWSSLRRLFSSWVWQEKEYCSDPEGRKVHLGSQKPSHQNERHSQKPYISNAITSSRYTIYNFLPRQLVFQFSKVANIYFLTVSILQMIPGLSTTGTYTTIIPLSIFIAIAMAREGYDDIRRHKLDTAENNMLTSKIDLADPESFPAVSVAWRSLKVGDLVKLEQNECVPADLVLLTSEHASGLAYLETAALDGETSLKHKRVVPFDNHRYNLRGLISRGAFVHSESPNRDLHSYEGALMCEQDKVPLTNDNVIYRGSILRNTPSILALVVFTGEETKIRLNASAHVRIKKPRMQKQVNKVVVSLVAFVIGLSIFCTGGYYIWHNSKEVRFWYLNAADSIAFLPIFISFLILYNTMVPLSLYVSMEIVKLIQQILLQQDIDMYHAATNTPAEARTTTINEELGQITHIFSDKTGTLTDNEMVFRKLSVAGHAWLHDVDIQKEIAEERPFLFHKARKSKTIVKRSATMDIVSGRRNSHAVHRSSYGNALQKNQVHAPALAAQPHRTESSDLQSTTDLLRHISQQPHTIFARRARLSLIAIALCHTAIPNIQDKTDSEPTYSASSPDELALVKAAVELGYVLINRDAQTVCLKTRSDASAQNYTYETYQMHEVLEFSSDRKRMSILTTFPDGRICIICKGADTVLLERLRHKDLAKKKFRDVQEQTKKRNSVEAEKAMARKSMARPSISRPSTTGANRLSAMRNLDHYLASRKDSRSGDGEPVFARRSMQYTLRHSIAIGEARAPLERPGDTIVDENIAKNEGAVLERTFQHLQTFASEGLRVLLYGHRFLSAEEYSEWKKLYQAASTSFENRQQKIDEVSNLLERNLELTAATAIEDKLQEGVPQSIEKLRRAGINLWMLTGDKRETAINIGHSAGLLKDYSTKIVLDCEEPDIADIIMSHISMIKDQILPHTALIVDGTTLEVLEQDHTLWHSFMQLAIKVDTTICCRASPAQKASLVRSVRKAISTSVTLAIGDGANDIAMIKEAHVGVGIAGKEGLQAARSSDYSIAQFRFLVKLLLVHGRWNYIRISKYVLGTFYKEMLLFLTQAVYQRFAGYTGTSLHESWDLSLFNTLFSSLAVICLGSFEKDLSAATLLAVPELYETSRTSKAFSLKILLGWFSLAATQAVVCFYLAYFSFAQPAATDLYPFGNMIFTAIVVVINVKLIFVEMHTWSAINYAFFSISFCGWWLWSAIQAAVYGTTSIYFVKDSFFVGFGRDLGWWTSLLLVTSIIILLDVCTQAIKFTIWPSEEDIFRELQSDKALKARLEEEAALELQAGWIEDLLARRDDNYGNIGDRAIDDACDASTESDKFPEHGRSKDNTETQKSISYTRSTCVSERH